VTIQTRPGTRKAVRQVWHLGGGSLFPVLSFFVTEDILLLLLTAATVLALLIDVARVPYTPVQRMVSGLVAVKWWEPSGISNSTYLLLGTLAAFIAVPAPMAAVSVLFLATAYPAASTVGERWVRYRLGGKSLEGSLAFLGVALVAGMILLGAGVGPGLNLLVLGALMAAATDLDHYRLALTLLFPLPRAAQ
jgi:dolichol kinase